MKKILLTFTTLLFLLTISFSTEAQVDRKILMEEFTNASCGPCADQNPSYNALIENNREDVISIKYQTAFPGFDPMNEDNPEQVQDRFDYYGNISGVPTGFVDGEKPTFSNGSYAGAPGAYTQSTIDGYLSEDSPLSVNVEFTANSSVDSLTYTVTVMNMSDETIQGDPRLFVAISEREIAYPTAPGSNGETEFYDVMRSMPSSISGIEIDSISSMGTFEISSTVAIPGYLYDVNDINIISWVQDYQTKSVYNAAESGTKDISDEPNVILGLVDFEEGAYNDEKGELTLEFSQDSPNSLEAVQAEIILNENQYENIEIDIPAEGESVEKTYTINYESGINVVSARIISLDNGEEDRVVELDNSIAPFIPFSLEPSSTSFVDNFDDAVNAGITTDYYYSENPGNNTVLGNYGAYGQSDYCFWVQFWVWQSGEEAKITRGRLDVSDADSVTISFDHAHTSYQGSNDMMRVEYSTDIGETWNLAKEFSSSDLKTAPEVNNPQQFFEPSNSEWDSVNIGINGPFDGDDMIFRYTFTTDYGDMLYLDNIGATSHITSSISSAPYGGSVSLQPNPAANYSQLNIDLKEAVKTSINIYNSNGQMVKTIVDNQYLRSGKHGFDITDLITGTYFVKVSSENGLTTKKLIITQ